MFRQKLKTLLNSEAHYQEDIVFENRFSYHLSSSKHISH